MSELKLNLIDSQTILSGTIHGSVIDSCIAALSAEPETIPELAAALGRYIKGKDEDDPFGWFRQRSEIDAQPYDAGIVIIDLAARIVATESTYSNPTPEGEVHYHDGHQATDVSIPYRLPADWLFVRSIDAHRWSRERHLQERQRHLQERQAPADFRAVLFGRPLLEFIVESLSISQISNSEISNPEIPNPEILPRFHATWLTTPRADLQNRSPRDVMLDKQDFIDFDRHTRTLQWSFLNEGPPCLASDSFAYRFAGFGTHEWVVYYDLVRYLLEHAAELDCRDTNVAVDTLEQLKTGWLETPNPEYDGRTPAVIIDNERRRLPEAMSPEQMIISEDCECCRMMAQDATMGFGPGFWGLDGAHMENEFEFSSCRTMAEWELENQRREESYRRFELECAEREHERRSRQREWDEEQMRIECGESDDEALTLEWPIRNSG